MSKKQAIAFFEEISKNQQLAREVEKVVRGKNSDEEKAKELISLAKKHNFNFTKEETASVQGTLKKPLSPEEMLEVSGGKMNLKASFMAAAMLLGLGASGATLHSMEASAMKRTLSGKRGISDLTEPTQRMLQPVGGQQQTAPQTQPATTGTANSRQNETPSSNDQGSAQSDSGQTMRFRPSGTSSAEAHGPKPLREEKKAQASKKHDNKAAERYSGVDGCGSHQVEWVRRVSGSGALPSADWPASPPANLDAAQTICHFCGGKLRTRGKNALDVKCANAGCIYNWVFPPTGDKQRGRFDFGHCARWALLPALILDSRNTYINSTGNRGRGIARQLAIETPAEAWAVWQLIVGHNNGWADVRTMMAAHNVDPTIQNEVVRLLDESYGNLVLGNESFIDLGSEVQQLVAGPNDDWQQIRTTMEQRGYNAEEAIKLLEKSCDSLTVEQRKQSELSKEERQQMLEEKRRQAEEARRQAREEARQQAIEMLQRVEKLSVEQAKKIAPMLTCGNCGNTGAKDQNTKGNIYFYCKSCKDKISNKPADLLAMLQAAAPETAPVEMVPAEPNEPQMQFEIQPMHINQGEGPTYEIKFHWDAAPQMSMQGMNQFNPGQQMMTYNHDDFENTFIEPYQLQTGDPNDFTFNMGHSHAPIHHHLTVYQMDGSQQPVNVQMQNMDQNQQPMNDQSDLTFDQTQILQQNSDHNFQFDHIGDYVNALNTATQELAQCNNMLTTITDNPLFANVEMVRNVVASAQAVVNRVFARGLQEPANQIILNTLSADDRYLEAAQAFSGQLEIFNNMLEIIQK